MNFWTKKNPGNLWKNVVGKFKKFQVGLPWRFLRKKRKTVGGRFSPPALNRVYNSWIYLGNRCLLLKYQLWLRLKLNEVTNTNCLFPNCMMLWINCFLRIAKWLVKWSIIGSFYIKANFLAPHLFENSLHAPDPILKAYAWLAAELWMLPYQWRLFILHRSDDGAIG